MDDNDQAIEPGSELVSPLMKTTQDYAGAQTRIPVADSTDLVASSHEIARRILPLLGRHGIPVTPTNYRLWYEYFRGEQPALREALDRLIRDGVEFTSELSQTLYQRFFSLEATEEHHRQVSQAGDRIQAMAVDLVKSLLLSIAQTGEYSQSLRRHVKDIEAATTLAGVKDILTAVIAQTGVVIKNQGALHQQLDKTTQDLSQLQEELRRREEMALTDELTGLKNRRAFNNRLTEEISRTNRYGGDLSLIMLDIDDFKAVNDRFGHLVGDRLLSVTAKAVRLAVRSMDIPCRYGGEEFAIICPSTDLAGAATVAQRLRQAIDNTYFTVKGTPIPTTISGGVSTLQPNQQICDLIERADQALYLAKQKGKNRIETETALPRA